MLRLVLTSVVICVGACVPSEYVRLAPAPAKDAPREEREQYFSKHAPSPDDKRNDLYAPLLLRDGERVHDPRALEPAVARNSRTHRAISDYIIAADDWNTRVAQGVPVLFSGYAVGGLGVVALGGAALLSPWLLPLATVANPAPDAALPLALAGGAGASIGLVLVAVGGGTLTSSGEAAARLSTSRILALTTYEDDLRARLALDEPVLDEPVPVQTPADGTAHPLPDERAPELVE